MAKKITKIKIPKAKISQNLEMKVFALRAMEASEGWSIMLKNILDNLEYLEECILEKKQTGVSLNDLEVDRLRDKRGFLKELVNLPQKFADTLEKGETKIENFDPYFKDASEIIAERKRK